MCIGVSDFSRAAPLAKGMATWSCCCLTKVKLKESSRCDNQGPRPRRYCRRSRRIDFSGAFTRDYRLVGDARSITRIVMAAGIAPTTRCHDVASSCQLPQARLYLPLLAFCLSFARLLVGQQQLPRLVRAAALELLVPKIGSNAPSVFIERRLRSTQLF